MAAHAALCEAADLVMQRRALYALVAEQAGCGFFSEREHESVLDSPVARGALGRRLADGTKPALTDLIPIERFSDPAHTVNVRGHRVAVASEPGVGAALVGPLDHVTYIVGQQDEGVWGPTVLDRGHDDFAAVYALVVQGLELAHQIDPDMTEDLLHHVRLVAVLDTATSGRLGSASVREYPGLIIIPCPRHPLHVAEALMHEGAHQKYFDLGIVFDFLRRVSADAPPFEPSWAAPGTRWALPQAFAAWHAYSCLARFGERMSAALRRQLDEASLVPFAVQRRDELGGHVATFSPFLGADARRLFQLISGFDLGTDADDSASSGVDVQRWAAGGDVIVRRCSPGERAVAVRGSDGAPDAVWLDRAAVDRLIAQQPCRLTP